MRTQLVPTIVKRILDS